MTASWSASTASTASAAPSRSGGTAASASSSHWSATPRHARAASASAGFSSADGGLVEERRHTALAGVRPTARPGHRRSRGWRTGSRTGRRPSAKTRGQALAFRSSVIRRAHLRQAGSENESDGIRRWSTWASRPARIAARRRSAGIGPGVVRNATMRCLNEPIRPRAAAITAGATRNGFRPRSSTTYEPSASRPMTTTTQAVVPGQVVWPGPDPDRLEVHRGNDGHAGVEACIERRAGALRTAGIVERRAQCPSDPASCPSSRDPWVLPLVPESEGEDGPRWILPRLAWNSQRM